MRHSQVINKYGSDHIRTIVRKLQCSALGGSFLGTWLGLGPTTCRTSRPQTSIIRSPISTVAVGLGSSEPHIHPQISKMLATKSIQAKAIRPAASRQVAVRPQAKLATSSGAKLAAGAALLALSATHPASTPVYSIVMHFREAQSRGGSSARPLLQ